jgi:hypothetical protein
MALAKRGVVAFKILGDATGRDADQDKANPIEEPKALLTFTSHALPILPYFQ